MEWEPFFLVLPLMLSDALVAAAVIGLLLRRRALLRAGALPWLVIPTAFLGLSAIARMTPVFFGPIQQLLSDLLGTSGDYGLLVLWYVDMFLRLPAWAALIYGFLWKLPAPEPSDMLDVRSRHAAATAALLAVLLTTNGPPPAEASDS